MSIWLFLHQLIYQLLKNISSSGDLSIAQEYIFIRWFISFSRIFHQVIYQLLKNISPSDFLTAQDYFT